MNTFTPDQLVRIKKTADFCFQNGYSSTLFARAVNTTVQICAGIDVDSTDDFYNMVCGNEAMKDLLLQVGYGVSRYGYGIYINKRNPNNVTYGTTNESTWQ